MKEYRIVEMPNRNGTYEHDVVYYVQMKRRILWFTIWISVIHGSGTSFWTDIKWAKNFMEELERGLKKGWHYHYSFFKPSQSWGSSCM